MLVVHGSADSDLPPAVGEAAAAAIPGAERRLLDAGTHMAFFTDPGEEAQARALEVLRAP